MCNLNCFFNNQVTTASGHIAIMPGLVSNLCIVHTLSSELLRLALQSNVFELPRA